jgi:hypothetical protein
MTFGIVLGPCRKQGQGPGPGICIWNDRNRAGRRLALKVRESCMDDCFEQLESMLAFHEGCHLMEKLVSGMWRRFCSLESPRYVC